MIDQLNINERVFFAVRLAAGHVSYSKDYITRLARERKIKSVLIGRVWYVDVQALVNYESAQKNEADLRRQQLRLQRQHELRLRERLAHTATDRPRFAVAIYTYSAIAAALIITIGFGVGAQLAGTGLTASVSDVVLHDVQAKDVEPSDQKILVPEFTVASDRYVIEDGRTVVAPHTEKDWLRIRYD